jgi:hypothetical protein
MSNARRIIVSERGRRFVEGWVTEHVHPTGYEPEGDNSEARQLTELCLAAARAKGISKKEIEEDIGNIEDYMSEVIDEVNDAEVARLAGKY